MIYKPISIDAWGFVDVGQTVVRIYLQPCGIKDAKRCPLELTRGKPLYCTRDGHFFSLTRFGLREVKPCFAVPKDSKVCHTRYPFMRQFGDATCHKLMAETWVERLAVSDRDGNAMRLEVDHINGDMLDWRADNLEWVTPKENRRRAKVLRELRAQGLEPTQMSYAELRSKMSEKETTDMGCRDN